MGSAQGYPDGIHLVHGYPGGLQLDLDEKRQQKPFAERQAALFTCVIDQSQRVSPALIASSEKAWDNTASDVWDQQDDPTLSRFHRIELLVRSRDRGSAECCSAHSSSDGSRKDQRNNHWRNMSLLGSDPLPTDSPYTTLYFDAVKQPLVLALSTGACVNVFELAQLIYNHDEHDPFTMCITLADNSKYILVVVVGHGFLRARRFVVSENSNVIVDDVTLLPWDVEEENFGIILCLIEDAWKPSTFRVAAADPAVARVSEKYQPPVQISNRTLSQLHIASLPTELPSEVSMLDDTELSIEYLEPSAWATKAFPVADLCQRALNRSEAASTGTKIRRAGPSTRTMAKRPKT